MHPPKTIGFEIKSLANLIKRCIDENAAYSGLTGLTGMQGWIIRYLYKHAGDQEVFQRDIEREFMIRRSTATGILQLMEKNALLTREAVEYDARLKKLKLTPKAVAIYERIRERIIEVEQRLCRGLSEEEVASFFSIIDKIRRNLEETVK